MKHTERCPYCRGVGRMPLAREYQATWDALAASEDEMSGAELGRWMGVQPTAMNNRLALLEQKGFATSRVVGRRRLFKAVTPQGA